MLPHIPFHKLYNEKESIDDFNNHHHNINDTTL
jgi:hypothetical protein